MSMCRIAMQQPIRMAFMSVILMLLTSSCSGEPIAPIMTFEGNTTNNAKLEIRWPRRSVSLSGREIATALELEEGMFKIRNDVLSARSGLPTLIWWGEEIRPHRLEITVDRVGTNMIVQVLDTDSGKTLFRRTAADDSMGVAASVPQVQFSVADSILRLPDGQLDLAEVLRGGKWRAEPSLVKKGYDGVVEWECVIPQFNIKGPMPPDICYCQFSPESDDPTCWGYRRLAYAAFKKITEDKIRVIVFEANFSSPDTVGLLPKRSYTNGEPRIYVLEKEQ